MSTDITLVTIQTTKMLRNAACREVLMDLTFTNSNCLFSKEVKFTDSAA